MKDRGIYIMFDFIAGAIVVSGLCALIGSLGYAIVQANHPIVYSILASVVLVGAAVTWLEKRT